MLLDGGCREGRKNKTEFSCKSSQENWTAVNNVAFFGLALGIFCA